MGRKAGNANSNHQTLLMNEMPNEIQWAVLCDRIRTLAQLRYCVYDLQLEGGFLFVKAKSCDDETVRYLFIINSEGESL